MKKLLNYKDVMKKFKVEDLKEIKRVNYLDYFFMMPQFAPEVNNMLLKQKPDFLEASVTEVKKVLEQMKLKKEISPEIVRITDHIFHEIKACHYNRRIKDEERLFVLDRMRLISMVINEVKQSRERVRKNRFLALMFGIMAVIYFLFLKKHFVSLMRKERFSAVNKKR